MLRSPARPEAAFRGVAVGVVTFAAGLTAHAFAMRSMSSAPMSESGSLSTTGHDMASMTGHAMPMAGHDMASMHAMHAAHGMAPVPPAAPSIPPLSMLLLAAVCALLALVASRPRAAGPAATGGMLLLGQGVGHLALGLTLLLALHAVELAAPGLRHDGLLIICSGRLGGRVGGNPPGFVLEPLRG